ncbi:hypothetical protein FGU71_05575 [Erythrobacter insulae]|uniref:Lipoprotein n=1 Tax=Erythrobacter insulae TaxID=2584124 RepID=A0A547PBH1_9SPHN|nr:hypothetical protein [Erythrobacter insulae]TRD11374.1 hypothetical protein FGU71_05575 [Erythrobacter insulae]
MRALPFLTLAAAGLSLSGCVVGAVADVVTAPVRVGSKAVDLATTSQSEADEKRGREIRKREEQLGKLERRYGKELRDCQDGDRGACAKAQLTYREMQTLTPAIPVEPEPED